MKKILFITLTFLIGASLNVKAQEIYGDWIKAKVTYLNGTELPDNNVLKYQFLRYSFKDKDKLFLSVKYDNKGSALAFARDSNILQILNSYGDVINSFQIESVSNSELILVQSVNGAFNDDTCLKYQFINEKTYQNQLPLLPSDVLYSNENNTVYKVSEKIHPEFLGDKTFHAFCLERIHEKSAVESTDNLFISTFIVTKDGEIKNIQILEKINDRFEKQFLRVLNKSKKRWIPAELNGEKVDVQMIIQFKFFSSNSFLSMYEFSKNGKTALDNNEFLKALNYFDLALENYPNNIEIVYQKAICQINLGNAEAACEGLEKVQASGEMDVEELIMKNCKN